MAQMSDFEAFTRMDEPLAPYTFLKLGGPAQYLVQPRTHEELANVVRHCFEEKLPLRVLGNGCNLLVNDEGVQGVVLRLCEDAFTRIDVDETHVKAATGATVTSLISASARHELAGLETLVGIPGTVGGALRVNAGDRTGDIGQFVHQVEVLDQQGQIHVREREELTFKEHHSNLDDPVILTAKFVLEKDSADAIVKRMRRAWIQRKGSQPHRFQSAGRLFENPRGLSASSLIEQAGLSGTRVGGVSLSDRDPNYVVVHSNAASRDVTRLLDMVKTKVRDQFNVELEQQITIW